MTVTPSTRHQPHLNRTARLDAYQRHHTWLGLPIAVVYKFVDDQGGYLCALLTYYGFLSLFPLLLVAVTVLGFVMAGDLSLQSELISSTLAQFPIVGKQLQTDVHGFKGSGAGLVIGLIVATYGGLGIAQAAQHAMNVAWAVPRNSRPNPLKARLRSLIVVFTLGIGVIATTGVSAVVTGWHIHGTAFDAVSRVLAAVVAAIANIGLFTAAFRFLTVRPTSTRDVIVGAAAGGVAWQVLQSVGAYYVRDKLKGASEIYGTFGVVLGLVAWIYLEAVIVVVAAELNVVLRCHLWPRSLLTPFTDAVSLTRADEDAYDSYARAQRHKGFERIAIDWHRPGPGRHGHSHGDCDHENCQADGQTPAGPVPLATAPEPRPKLRGSVPAQHRSELPDAD